MAKSLGDNVEKKLIGGAAQNATQRVDTTVFVGNVGEKRYLWTARAFAVVTAISLCCNFVLLLAIMQVIPLFRIEPFLLTFQDKEDQVYNIQPIGGRMEDRKAITEVFVREYVLLRSSFNADVPEMEARWMPSGPVQEMSTSSVYSNFLDNTAKKALEVIRREGVVRDVKILTVNELSRGLWQVEYETRDMKPSSPTPELNYWTASIRLTYRRKVVKYGERLKNPIGFTVTEYALRHNKIQ